MATLQQVAPPRSSRLLLDNILVATDFSEVSNNSLEYAMALAKKHRAKINVVHVVAPLGPAMEAPLYDVLERERKIGAEQLAGTKKSVEHEKIPCETFLRFGDAASVVDEITSSKHINLIVLGTHGATGVERLALGSTAEEIFRHAKCPVLTVGPQVPRISRNPVCIVNVLFATDFGSESMRAVPYVVSLAQDFQAFTYLTHILANEKKGRAADKTRERQVKLELKALMPDKRENRSIPSYSERKEDTVENILKLAKEKKADLIVLGARKAPAIVSHLRAGVAYQVAARASCPVLTVT
jgi:nucleotide-binding universal stress UspA family protein